jgi:ADP-ribosylglycohydrolase
MTGSESGSWLEKLDVEHSTRGADAAYQRPPELTRFVGALVGGAIGDALGRPVEGWWPSRIRERYGRLTEYQKWHGWKGGPIGTITDDTQLTTCVAECLTHNGFLDPADLARRFVDWLPRGRGKGGATTRAVERLAQGVPWYLAGEDSAANGAAMRSAPVGLARWNDPLLLRAEAILSALPTHRNPMGVAGAVAMAAGIAFLLTREADKWTPQELVAEMQAAIAGLEPHPQPERRDPGTRTTLHDRLGEIPELLPLPPDEVFDRLYNGAYVLESLPAALFCFLRTPRDVEETLLLAVNAGHDADTVAAMAGTLGGALGGLEALPQRLLTELEHKGDLEALAEQLFFLSKHGDSAKFMDGAKGP